MQKKKAKFTKCPQKNRDSSVGNRSHSVGGIPCALRFVEVAPRIDRLIGLRTGASSQQQQLVSWLAGEGRFPLPHPTAPGPAPSVCWLAVARTVGGHHQEERGRWKAEVECVFCPPKEEEEGALAAAAVFSAEGERNLSETVPPASAETLSKCSTTTATS